MNSDSLKDAAGGGLDSARDAVTSAADHPAVEAGARIGYGANAVMHLVIALIAAQFALGNVSGKADQSGALGMLASSSWGALLLWVGVVGWALLGLWQLGEALLPWAQPGDRAKAVAKTVVYAVLAWTCFGFARHHGTSSTSQNVGTTKNLLSSGTGRAAVVLAGLVVIGVGVYHVLKGLQKRFLRDLREHPGEWAEQAGRIGYVAKGVALGVAGLLVLQAGVSSDARKASGLDGAFRTVLDAPFGRVLVALIALGFACYAVYSVARARYARV